MSEHTAERIYHLSGVPLRSGSHYPGSENDAQAYRDVGISERLVAGGCLVVDEGDIAIPSAKTLDLFGSPLYPSPRRERSG